MIFNMGIGLVPHSYNKDQATLNTMLFLNRRKVFRKPFCTDFMHTQMIMKDSANCGIRKFGQFYHFLEFHLVLFLLRGPLFFHYHLYCPTRSCVILTHAKRYCPFFLYIIERGSSAVYAIQSFLNNLLRN